MLTGTRISPLLVATLLSNAQCAAHWVVVAEAKPYDTSLRVGLTLEGEAPEPFLPSGEVRVTHFGRPDHVNLNFAILVDINGNADELFLDGEGVPE